MNTGLYHGAAAMRSNQERLDVIAHNLANVNTVGFKRHGTTAHIFEVQTPDGSKRDLKTKGMVDWSQGNLARTGETYDLALFGDGFFAVDSPVGEVYTREGQFRLTADGVLTTPGNSPVSWKSKGATIDPHGLPVVIDGGGQVMQGEQNVGQLRLADFADHRQLVLNSAGFWEAPPTAKRIAHTAVVHQGALESSNATGLEEVVAMVSVQRAFEAASNVMSVINESYQRLTRTT